MKILQVNKFFYRRGGAEQHMFDLMDLLRQRGHTVIPFAMRHPMNEKTKYDKYFVSSVDFSRISINSMLRAGRIVYSFEAKKKITRLIEKEKPDIAHLHLIYHYLSPSVLVALKKQNIPTVMTIHDWSQLCPNYILHVNGKLCTACRRKSFFHVFADKAIKNSYLMSGIASAAGWFHHKMRYYEEYVDRYIAPSAFVKDIFVSKYGWSQNKIDVIPHFLSSRIKKASITSPVPDETRFVYIGRLSHEKGVDKLVEYWYNHKLPYKLDIYGVGPQEEFLNKWVLLKGMNNVVFHGFVNRSVIMKNLKKATAVIVPSRVYETFGLVVMEAFAAGVPVVAHRYGALTEIVNQSSGGVLFDWRGGGYPLKAALEDIKNKPVYRKLALSYIKTHHQPEVYYENLLSLYKKIQK